MRPIKAFTMLEALISLILTGIIIALSYSLFTLVNKQMTLFEKENTAIIEYNLFHSTLTNDINNSNNFEYTDDELVLKNYFKPYIIYKFKTNYVTRSIDHHKPDSFKIQTFNTNYKTITPKHNQLNMSISLLNDTVQANYFLTKQNSSVINQKLFHED
jgi:competence protein ComGF